MKTSSLLISLIALFISLPLLQAQEEEKDWSNTPFEIKTVDAQKALVIKADIPISEISAKMGEIYQKVFTYTSTHEIQLAGPAFAVYYSWDPEGNIVFEAGVPVVAGAEGKDDIIYKEYDPMKVLSTLYKGSYENMEPVYNAIMQYMSDNELEAAGPSWEVYLTDPEQVSDPKMNQTLIYFQVK